MAFRPNGVPVTGVPGMPQMVGFNQTIVGQPMTMVPMMQPTMIGVPVRNVPQMVQVRASPLGPQIIGQAIQQSDGPPVTVFVGNISEKATDTLVRQILMKCGTVNNWKRVQGASGKLQAFGFCEFKEPDSALRALRLLQGYLLANKSLLIKVDDNAQTIIEQWKKRVGVAQDSDGMDVLSPQVKNRDEAVRTDLKHLLREYATDLIVDDEDDEIVINEKPSKNSDEKRHSHKSDTDRDSKKSSSGKGDSKSKGDDISKEDYGEKKDIIVDQIHQFRESQKRQEDEKNRKPDDKQSRERRGEPDKRDERDRPRRSTSRTRRDRSKEKRSTSRRRDRSRSRDRTRERTRERSRERVERRRRSEERRKDEDELVERRRLERKIKEKDSAYQERLVGWEARERRKTREWERIESRDSEIRRQMYKEAKRLRDFLENYDDERDDRKFYFGSGSAFQRRLENRDKEKESDMRDRRKEEEEIGGLRKKLASEGHPDPDGAIAKVIKEAEEVWKPFITPEVRKRKHSERSSSSSESETSSDSAPDSDDEPIDVHVRKKSADNHRNKPNVENETDLHHTSDEDDNDVDMEIAQPDHDDNHRAPIRLPGLSSTSMARNSPAANSPAFQSTFIQKEARSRKVASVFQDEEDDTNQETAKKRKVPVPREIKNAEEKRKAVKALIDRIPTDRGPLFAYPMVWENLTNDLMKNRITPWVQKKLHEIIGEDEPTLVAFITEKLESEAKPENILSEIRVVLDDEADMFVIKLWRLLIYETEARREGITS